MHASTPAPRRPALALAVMLSGLVAACGPENTYQAPPPPSVTVAPPLKKPFTAYLELTGGTRASQTADLTARVAGTLTAVNFKDGADVKQGDVLFTIESDQYQAQLALAEATVEQNQATFTGNQLELNRQQTLVASKTASQATLDKVKAEYDSSKAAVAAAQANVTLAQITLNHTQVTAPFDGRIERHLVDVGNLVGQSSPTKLATIQRITPLHVYFSLSETDVLRIRKMHADQGTTKLDIESIPVEVGTRDGTDYPYKGTLDYIAPSVNAATGTQELRGALPNENHALLPGMFVRVRVPVTTRDDALMVPQASVGASQAGSYVLVVGADNKVQTRVVKLGSTVGRLQVIESGLEAGDQVVVEGMMRALPGAEVAPRKVALADDGTVPANTAASTK